MILNVYFNQYIKKLKVPKLKEKCKKLGIKKYSKLNKTELSDSINQLISCKILQKWFRIRLSSSYLCNITQNKFKYPCWPFITQNNKKKYWYYYNLPELVDYFLTTGKFTEPHIGRSISNNELYSLDKYTKHVGIKRKSVYDAKKNPDKYRRMKLKEELINTFNDEIRNIIVKIRDRLLNIFDPLEQIMLYLDVSYYPDLNNYIKNLKRKVSKKDVKFVIEGCVSLLNEIHTVYPDEFRKTIKNDICKWLKKYLK